MERALSGIIGILASLLGLYSLFIVIRIILTWFPGAQHSGPARMLARITDPYLNWWRVNFPLRAGFLDLSPLVAMAALSVVQNICARIAQQGRVSLGIILAVCLRALWSTMEFLIGFCIIILVLRLIAYFCSANMYSPFWQVIDSISRPLLYRINRILFGRRIVGFKTGLIATIIVLGALWVSGRFAIDLLFLWLKELPI
jgi:YggT family protein